MIVYFCNKNIHINTQIFGYFPFFGPNLLGNSSSTGVSFYILLINASGGINSGQFRNQN